MPPSRLLAALTLVLALSASWPSAQTPPQQPPLPTGTGFISGQVIDIPSRKPVPAAIVRLSGRFTIPAGAAPARGSTSMQVMSDAQGRFFFGSLPAGNFSITAEKTGYG